MRLSVDGYAYMIMLQFGMLVLVAPAMTAGSTAASGSGRRWICCW